MTPSPKLQRFCGWLFARLGWSMRGEWPDLRKMVIIGAPHSSTWDIVLFFLMIQGTGVKLAFMGKQELFRMPVVGRISKHLGGIPVNRSAPGGVIEQAVNRIQNADRMWLAISPEGTRKKVSEWKTGFWRIAKNAGVPVCCVTIRFTDKVIEVGPVFDLGDNMATDISEIQAWYGEHREKNSNR